MRAIVISLAAIFLTIPCLSAELRCENRDKRVRLTAQIVNANTLSKILLVTADGQVVLEHQHQIKSTILPMDGLSVVQGSGLFKIGRTNLYTAPQLTPKNILEYTKRVEQQYGYKGANTMMNNGDSIQLTLLCQIH